MRVSGFVAREVGGGKWHGRKEQRVAEFFRRVACLISMAEYIKM